MDEVGAVLAGPRGRRFCAEVACLDDDVRAMLLHAAYAPGDEPARRRFLDALAGSGAPRSDITGDSLLTCLADAVAHARYWQEPDEVDVLLTDRDVVRALRPVAGAVVAAPSWRWWTSPLETDDQAHVQWISRHPTDPPRLTGAADGLQTWRRQTLEDEHEAQGRPDDPAATSVATRCSFSRLLRIDEPGAEQGQPGEADKSDEEQQDRQGAAQDAALSPA